MKKINARTIRLQRETLRTLSDAELTAIDAGRINDTVGTDCDPGTSKHAARCPTNGSHRHC